MKYGRSMAVLVGVILLLATPRLMLAQEYSCPPDSARIADFRESAAELRALAREPGTGLTSQAAFLQNAAEYDRMADEWIAYCANPPRPTPTPTPRADPSPTPEADTPPRPSPTAVSPAPAGEAGRFASPDYGFSLEWGPEWSLQDQTTSGNGFQGVVVGNGTSLVIVAGITTSETPQATVENIARSLDPGLRFDTLIADEPDLAAAYFLSADERQAVFIQAEVRESGTLTMAWAFPRDQYATELEAFQRLLSGLRK